MRASVCDKYIYIFTEKVDRDHVWCRGGGAKETSAPEWDLHRYAGAESEVTHDAGDVDQIFN